MTIASGLLSLGGLAMPVCRALGVSEVSSWPCFALAALLAAVGTLAWAAVVFLRSPRGEPRLVAWVAFPVAIGSLMGMFPLLAAAAAPDLLDLLASPHRLELRRRGAALELHFPRAMREDVINLELDGSPVPPDYFRRHPGRASWSLRRGVRPRSVLHLDLEAIRADLELPPVRSVGLNRALDAPQMRDEEGERYPPQVFDVP